MNSLVASLRGLAVGCALFSLVACAAAPSPAPIKVLLLTGQCNGAHNWGLSSVILKRLLEQPGRFTVDSVISPPKGGDMSGFKPGFAKYDVVVMDFEGDDWPEATQEAFEVFIRQGGGLVSFHATDNAFPKWSEFNEMIGVGGWGGRDESWGPKVRWRDGKVVLDASPGRAGHPPRHDFPIVVRAPEHPVMKGLPLVWMHPNDEIYSQLRGPAKNLEVLATALADKSKFERASGEHEPMLMTIRYGEGRIFHTTLGHVGPKDEEPVPSVSCVGFITTFLRGTEWAATGRVTLGVPEDFPTADAVSVRK